MSTWRLAHSLDTLRDQVDAAFPGRDKSSDGTIGDARHAATKSEHNPDANGVVRAMDISNDPAHGLTSRALAEALLASRDTRILYVISNREINSSQKEPWTWRPYTGVNAHEHHMHISVVDDPALYDDTRPWDFSTMTGEKPADPPTPALPALPDWLKPSAPVVPPEPALDDTVAALRHIMLKEADTKLAAFKADLASDLIHIVDKIKGLSLADPLPAKKPDGSPAAPGGEWFVGIITTEFGGSDDPNKSAYTDQWIDGSKLIGALPYHFAKPPQIEALDPETGRTAIIQIDDVGPRYPNAKKGWPADPYWDTHTRPRAESDTALPKSNGAGLDLTPGAWAALGRTGVGKMKLNWRFVTPQTKGKPASPGSTGATAMPTWLMSALINWKTTAAGLGLLVTAGTKFVTDIKSGAVGNWADDVQTLMAAFGGMGLIAAKDKNVTGGTTPNAT